MSEKINLDFWQRAYLANLARRRAMECFDKANRASLAEQQQAWGIEGDSAREMAHLLDEGEEIREVNPIRAAVGASDGADLTS